MGDEAKPLSDRLIDGLKNRRPIAYLIVVATVIGGVATFTDSVSKLWNGLLVPIFSRPDLAQPATPEILKANLIKLAYEGCYFYRWDHSSIMEVPDYASDAQQGYYDQLMGKLPGGAEGKLMIEGYVEPAYTREYALALGQRRAEALKAFLIKKYDLNAANIVTVSYGRDRPTEQTAEYFCGGKLTADHRS